MKTLGPPVVPNRDRVVIFIDQFCPAALLALSENKFYDTADIEPAFTGWGAIGTAFVWWQENLSDTLDSCTAAGLGTTASGSISDVAMNKIIG